MQLERINKARFSSTSTHERLRFPKITSYHIVEDVGKKNDGQKLKCGKGPDFVHGHWKSSAEEVKMKFMMWQ